MTQPVSRSLRLAEHFTLIEFACKCSCGREKAPEILAHLRRLAPVLERMRAYFGRPVKILSGVRCVLHNRACGGAPASKHLEGIAADVFIAGVPVALVEEWAMKQPEVGGCHGYRGQGFTHLDLRPRVNGHVVTWEG